MEDGRCEKCIRTTCDVEDEKKNNEINHDYGGDEDNLL